LSAGRIGVFLDRDGTLNEERDFIGNPDDVRLIDGAGEAVRRLNEAGIVTCVISNQSGVARGFFTEADVERVHARLEQELASVGAQIDRVYYCPHHPEEGKPPYNIVCDCRKPFPGMLRRGERDFGLDLSSCYVVGDKLADIQAGKAVGSFTILVLTGYGEMSRRMADSGSMKPDHVVPSIVEAVDMIIQTLGQERGKKH
jgi:D-glycero-D-manno-heptose 1,7-bisphosphate phosphatase